MGRRWLALGSAAAIAVAVAAAFLLVGGPRTARLERLDERRAADLEALVTWIERHRAREGRLPETLGRLEPSLPGEVWALDPETQAPYRFEPLADGHFRVCATLAIPDKSLAERHVHARRIGNGRAIEPEFDPTGRQLCLRTTDPPGVAD